MCTIDSGSVTLPSGCSARQVSWSTRGEFRETLRKLKLANDWRALAVVNYVAGRPSPRRHAAFLEAVS